VWGLAPLADQQIGGLAMWIGGSVYYFLAFMVVFFIWASQDERDGRRLFVVRGSSG
jgi:cytochrome c oxidase assembly factor CtaG